MFTGSNKCWTHTNFLPTAIGGAMMITRKAFAVFTICTLSALSIPDVLSPRQVEAQPVTDTSRANCGKLVTGTYLIAISQNDNFAGCVAKTGAVGGGVRDCVDSLSSPCPAPTPLNGGITNQKLFCCVCAGTSHTHLATGK